MGMMYSQLFDFVRRERTHQELQDLPAGFYIEAKQSFDELADGVRADPFSADNDANRMQVINGKKLLRQLYEYREQKILHLAQARCRTGSQLVDTTRLLPSERKLFEHLVKVLREARADHGIEDDTPPPKAEAEAPVTAATPELMTIRIVKPVPPFMGKNMETYGPYEEGEQAELPGAVAELLIRKGNAEKA